METVSPTSRQEVDEIVDQTNFAVNTLPRMDGYSPHQHVFGKEHGIPGNLELRDEKLGEVSALQAGETMYLRRQEIRNRAQQSYIQAHEEDRVKRAVNHRTRPMRGPYNPGDMVYFWRMWPKEKKASWHGPGTVVGYHDGKSKLWIASGMKMYKCSPEQLRRVSPEQESLIRMMPEDLLGIQKNLQGRGSGNYVDLSMQTKPSETEQESDHMELSLDRDVIGLSDGSVGGRRVRPRIDEDMGSAVPISPPGEPDNAGVTSPYEPESPVATPQGMHVPTEVMTESLGSDEPQQEPEQTNPSPEGGNEVETSLPSPEAVQMSGEFGPVRTQNALMTALRRNADMLDFGGPIRRQESQQEHGHEAHMSEKRRGRREIFEKELSACHDMSLRRAKKKEWNKLISSGAVRVLSKEESDKVRQDKHLGSRILKSRFVLTKADDAELSCSTEIKARWCIRGYLDPDILSLDTEAPTLSAEGAAIALQNIASHQWDLQICDVEGAFLRGDDLHRQQGRVFVSQPPGGLEDLEPGVLIEAVKAVYGLADAPLAWYESFSRTLLELQCRRSKLDGCVYYAYSNENPTRVIGVIALHVDDMCLGGNSEFVERILKPLKEKYPFKHWHEKKGNFLGRWLEQLPNGDITIQQTEYAQNVKGIEISPQRKKEKDSPTTEDEKRQMKAVLGAINWLVTGSRPDLAAGCSLLQQRVAKSVVEDMCDINRLVKSVHDNAHMKIKIKSIKPQDVGFLSVSDAAWANADQLCSQAGYMIAVVDKKIMRDVWADLSLLRWKSYKQDRKTPSTLGAELFALSRSLAETRWMRSMWMEANYADYKISEDSMWDERIPICAIVDNKPLFDHTNSSHNTNIKDKRHAIEMLIVKDDLRAHNIHLRWVATYQMIGDILTKRGVPVDLLFRVLDWGKFVVIEDKSMGRKTERVKGNYFRGV